MSKHKEPVPPGYDPALWEVAQNRASFKSHLATYVIVNGFFWVLWFFTDHHRFSFGDIFKGEFPWPVWPMFGWGIGLAFHFAGAYIFPGMNSVEKEYQKLKNNK